MTVKGRWIAGRCYRWYLLKGIIEGLTKGKRVGTETNYQHKKGTEPEGKTLRRKKSATKTDGEPVMNIRFQLIA